MRWIRALLVLFFLTLGMAGGAAAHESAEVRELQREVAELRALVERLLAAQHTDEGGAPATDADESGALAADAGKAAPQQAAGAGPRDAEREPPADVVPGEPEGLALPRLAVHGFGDVSYRFRHDDPTGGTSATENEFKLGDLDILVTSQIAPRLSFLTETLLEFTGSDNVRIDAERLLLTYEHADWANVSIGRGHLALGYWNRRFHHGTWLQTTVARPLFFEFEDEGGFLPMHYVGVEGSGAVVSKAGTLTYAASVANGRGRTVEEVQVIDDANDEKQVNVMFTFEPTSMPGFGLGANALYDKIPSDVGTPGRAGEMDEIIGGFHGYYVAYPYEAILEWQYIHHRDDRTTRTFRHHGGYAQVAYSVADLKPYYRFDWLGIETGDPYFLELGQAQDTTQHTVGLRWDWRTFAAIKTEYRRKNAETKDADIAIVNFSFAF